jgi:hypothetical protein
MVKYIILTAGKYTAKHGSDYPRIYVAGVLHPRYAGMRGDIKSPLHMHRNGGFKRIY